jgi:hypothetical protein
MLASSTESVLKKWTRYYAERCTYCGNSDSAGADTSFLPDVHPRMFLQPIFTHLKTQWIFSAKKISSSGILRRVAVVRRFLQQSRGDTSQKTAFFIVTAVKTSNLTLH